MRVVNKRNHVPTREDIYIGRPSPLGNPFSHLDNTLAQFKVRNRDEAVEKYRDWILEKIEAEDPRVLHALGMIQANSNLVCWCKPCACHGDIIKEILETHPRFRERFKK